MLLFLLSVMLGLAAGPARRNPGQLVTAAVEFGLPYNLAHTLENPLGQTLTALSVVGVSIVFLLGVLRGALGGMETAGGGGGVPLASLGLPPGGATSGRRRRAAPGPALQLDARHGLSLLGVGEPACQRRVVCDLHSVLASCPAWARAPLALLTARTRLGGLGRAARRGLRGEHCGQAYARCRRSNAQILAGLWPGLGRRRERWK
jgi:hypothetical protein